MAKIIQNTDKKQITKGIFYIDSAKFLCDSVLFDRIDIPSNIIEIDGDTGEQLREFKRNSLHVEYNNFTVYISNYTKILKGIEYKKVLLGFSAKITDNYLLGITQNSFKHVLEHLREKQYISYQDSRVSQIIAQFYTKDTDIAYNMIVPTKLVPEIVEQWKLIRKNAINKDKIKVGNAKNNKMIQFGHRGDKYFFKIYNKSLEIRKDIDEFDNLQLTNDERNMFLNNEYTMFRIEITIRNKKDFESLNTSSKLVDLWQLLEHNNKDIAKLVRRYYDEMTGSYKPKTKVMSKISPTDSIILAFLTQMYREKKEPIEMINRGLSLFDSDTRQQRKTKSRAKKRITELIDHLYTNSEEIKEQQQRNTEGYKYIEKMFFLDI